MATVEILFHADLTRVGDWIEIASVNAEGEEPLVFGREAPTFTNGRRAPRALADPCLSRAQARVGWSGRRGVFVVLPDPGAKRAVRLFDQTGRPLPPDTVEAPPGTWMAFGDRVLFLLAVQPTPRGDPLGMVGSSTEMVALRHRIGVLASLPDTVLLQGETGSGKELVARALHIAGARAPHPFIAINCASLPETLIESELFGYAKGAFSGAATARVGLFHAAGAGTILLDEIGELPLGTQAKLLRALEARAVRPVGAHHEEPFHARIVAATHRDLAADADAGRFRPDLYARLEAPTLLVPPLRERRADVPALLVAFLRARAEAHATLTKTPISDTPFGAIFRAADAYPPKLPLDHMLALLRHDWPRNVRELSKVAAELTTALLERAPLPAPPVSKTSQHEIPRERSSSPGQEPRGSSPGQEPRGSNPGSAPRNDARSRPSRDELYACLDAHDFNQADVARALGVPYTTLDRWMRELGVVRPRDLSDDDIRAARETAGGDLPQMARLLRVSVRGLKARIG